MTAAIACRTCGIEPREGARFCDGCGAPVTERNARAEYKQVTVVFADVVHSMEMRAAVGGVNLGQIQGATAPVSAQGVLDIVGELRAGRAESKLVGRHWELSTIES